MLLLQTSIALAALSVQVSAPVQATVPAQGQLDSGQLDSGHPGEPVVLYDVERVVDGDTIYVLRDGGLVKLRLLSVDTEEKLSGNPTPDPNKPETIFGEETMLWAQGLIADLAEEGQPPRVGLRFPNGVEQNDVYGRLLCHVVLPDGHDFNLLLVELGKSPYFNKYGNSQICHGAFVAAQERARAAKLGIWNQTTNAAQTPGAPEVRRPYERLIPWWNARAAAVEHFRTLQAEDPATYVDAQVETELAAALERGTRVQAFGSIDRFFDEDNGDWTLLMRASGGERALRVVIPAESRPAFLALGLQGTVEDYRQNYIWVEGVVGTNERGFVIRCTDPRELRIAN